MNAVTQMMVGCLAWVALCAAACVLVCAAIYLGSGGES